MTNLSGNRMVLCFRRFAFGKLVGFWALLVSLAYAGAAFTQAPPLLRMNGQFPVQTIEPKQNQPAQPPQPPQPPVKKDVLPIPKPLNPMNRTRLPCLGNPNKLGCQPAPSPEVKQKFGKVIKNVIDAENTLDLVSGRTRLLILEKAPKRIQIADKGVADYGLVSAKEITLIGKAVGMTNLNLWFGDPKDKTKEQVLSYLIRVFPDPEAKVRMECAYKALEIEINQTFPDSVVHLHLVGDKLVAKGQAKDVAEATQIMRILRAHAPGGNAAIPVAPPLAAPGVGGVVRTAYEDYLLLGHPNVINLIRIPGEQQVMLRVVVAEVNRAAARSIGINFNIMNSQGISVFANTTGNLAGGGLGLGLGNGAFPAFGAGGFQGQGGLALGGMGNISAALDNGQTMLAINALRNLNYARSLAEPNLVTLNGQTANFQAGGQFPVPVVTGFTAAGLQGVSFVPFGVQLSFTPYITDKDRIRLSVAAEVSSRDLAAGSTNIGGTGVPSLTTRNFNTVVELREGQTLAVAGLIQNNLGSESERIPLFGDLPVIGRLAAFDRISHGEQELVVLITPELVHPLEKHELPPLPGSDLFEPGDLEFYLLGRLESLREYDYRSPVMNDFHRKLRYRHCEKLYIIGPHGHCNTHDCLPPEQMIDQLPHHAIPQTPAAAPQGTPGAGHYE